MRALPCRAGAIVSVDREPGDEPQDELSAADLASGPTVVRMLLGGQLRKLREAAGITPERAGYEIRASRSKISRVEHGRVGRGKCDRRACPLR